MAEKSFKILLIGCGKMGASMMQSWLDNHLINTAYVIDPSGLPATLKSQSAVTHIADDMLADIRWNTLDLVILAIKPQIMARAVEQILPYLPNNAPLMSIAAGQSLNTLEGILTKAGHIQPIIRTMPNTPASIGKGITAAIANKSVSRETKQIVNALLEATGAHLWVEDEAQMDAITALSGSGPAYVFYLIETMARAGDAIGLSKTDAVKLARQTVIGAAALAEASPDIPASTLRENVTSKGGTTQAALDVLMDGRMEKLFIEALTKAKTRSIELSK